MNQAMKIDAQIQFKLNEFAFEDDGEYLCHPQFEAFIEYICLATDPLFPLSC